MENKELIAKLDKWMQDLTEYHGKKWGDDLLPQFAPHFTYTIGKKYIRIVQESNNQKFAFAFVDCDGNIYKCDGWKSPAKGIRATLENPPMDGSQLYKNYVYCVN